ncbi:PEPxxWA-CTERM sorting domain-containing protein [Sphingomonas flavalba]|uniref:PEPxxWA-CTERM sorting domain-containing protein n=1 Tax=Sphingomonas flavalba TaxID=2559804 RepID=UPI00109DFB59|nr:PEPxxWA-CTERM sorting domain-containing protein [Sphingomonas flavalba]
MLKEALTSSTAKLIAACVCPVAGTTALTVSVPQVRQAVHKATAPAPKARAKPKVRPAAQPAAPQVECPADTPILLSGYSIAPLTDLPPERFAGGPGGGDPGGGPGGPGPWGPGPWVPPGIPFVPPPVNPPVVPPVNPPVTPGVPEPATWAQLILGFGIIGASARVTYNQRKRRGESA